MYQGDGPDEMVVEARRWGRLRGAFFDVASDLYSGPRILLIGRVSRCHNGWAADMSEERRPVSRAARVLYNHWSC